MQLWRQQARACWSLPSHPGWGLLQAAVEDFEAALPPGSGASALLPAELAMPCLQDVMARLANLPPAYQLLALGQPPPQIGAAGGSAGGVGGASAAGAAGPDPAPDLPSAAASPPAPPAVERQPPPSPAQLAFEGQAAAPAGPEGHAAGPLAAGAGGAAADRGQAMVDQEPLASPYETALRLPSLPLLPDLFPSLPKANGAVISPNRLQFGGSDRWRWGTRLCADLMAMKNKHHS